MNRKMFTVTLMALLALLVSVRGATGQGPKLEGGSRPRGDISITATVKSLTSYQGVLKAGGTPVTGNRDMMFRLYSDGACMTLVDEIPRDRVPVTDGLFCVQLDVDQRHFNGQALWLGVEVNGTAIVCQEVLPVPYALSLRPGADIRGDPSGGHAVINAENEGGGPGVAGMANKGIGVLGCSASGDGVRGETSSTGDSGVFGYATADSGTSYGVAGKSASDDGCGVYGESSGIGIWGTSTNKSAVVGWVSNPDNINTAVVGWNEGGGKGVMGYSATSDGVFGLTNSTGHSGVYGCASNGGGITYGVYGESDSVGGYGVYGESKGIGVYGSGRVYGVWGQTDSSTPDSVGVYGGATAGSGRVYGVKGITGSTEGRGILGWATATSGETFAVLGSNHSDAGVGVCGCAESTSGETYGVLGWNASTTEGAAAVLGVSEGNQLAGSFVTGDHVAVWIENDTHRGATLEVLNRAGGAAGKFLGDVHITGNLHKSGGGFRIDHPLDPENMYLNHSFVESRDMMNVYNGNVVLDASGEAWVELPEYFEALNRDYRYQLTPVGGPAPNLHIAQEVSANRFKIAGGAAGIKVSWQVTGVRQDAWAVANRIVVEEEKPAAQRGLYWYPEVYGHSEAMGIGWADWPTSRSFLNE